MAKPIEDDPKQRVKSGTFVRTAILLFKTTFWANIVAERPDAEQIFSQLCQQSLIDEVRWQSEHKFI